MTQITLSKSNYLKESKRLESYERFLPSLDLKRKQLLLDKSKEQDALLLLQQRSKALITETETMFPMLKNCRFTLEGVVEVNDYVSSEENKMGIHLPKFESISFSIKEYGLMTKPLWVDLLCKKIIEASEVKVQLIVQLKRVEIMDAAVRKATQRVNLVSEILIPEAQRNMRKIKIFLSDSERASVVRSKIAKKKKRSQNNWDNTQEGVVL